MKSVNLLKLAIPALVLISGSAFAQITGTAHDMTAAGTYDNTGNAAGGQICVYCHTPHNATAVAGGPLWNRLATSVSPWTMYPAGGTIQGAVDTTPNPETIACLGCHDGVAAIDNISNLPGRDPDVTWGTTVGPIPGGNFALLDKDLSNDHPVSITYVPGSGAGQDDGLDLQANAETDGIVFFDTNKVECASCHDVHGTGLPAFLRVTSDNSEICLACHLK